MTRISLNVEDYSTLIIIGSIADVVSVITTPRHHALAYTLTHDEALRLYSLAVWQVSRVACQFTDNELGTTNDIKKRQSHTTKWCE
jgi:uncharacterized protein YhbP (UPF0306 family)